MEQRQQIVNRLNDVFRAVFEDDALEITEAMTAKDVEGWDSLTHITLIVAVEKEFGLRFPAAEVGKLANVGQLLAMIEARLPR